MTILKRLVLLAAAIPLLLLGAGVAEDAMNELAFQLGGRLGMGCALDLSNGVTHSQSKSCMALDAGFVKAMEQKRKKKL